MNMDGKPDLPLGVAEDHGLGDGQSVVQITKSIKLPLLPLYCHKELLYPLQSQLITEGVRHSNRKKQNTKRHLVLITAIIHLLYSCQMGICLIQWDLYLRVHA